jgi:ABC-type antimicrobial peptide transport system permease subunit
LNCKVILPILMILVGVLALAGPAGRAIRINPMEALRAN